MSDNNYEVIIIGGGPAGYSAGIYATRAMLKTLLIESCTVLSQLMLTDLIENYPGFPGNIKGYELIENLKKQARYFGLEIKEGFVEYIECINATDRKWRVVTQNKASYTAYSIIAASGAKAKMLGVKGEKELRGKGVSYCAVCDGAFFRNKTVAVVGGGDTSIQEALFLTRYASKVNVVHRRNRLRAEQFLQEQAFKNDKIEFIWDSIVQEIEGTDTVENIKLKNLKKDSVTDFNCDGVFIFVGFTPNTEYVRRIVKTDDTGWIITDGKMNTNVSGIFAAGDLRSNTYRQIATAVGDGVTAALSCEKYISRMRGNEYV
ncbi:MAG: thioredoxin-disulfide reductase [Spirochaetales bacterium]|nr:thioredoxin-disulfide reductase [Spirochaetales bacterium]